MSRNGEVPPGVWQRYHSAADLRMSSQGALGRLRRTAPTGAMRSEVQSERVDACTTAPHPSIPSRQPLFIPFLQPGRHSKTAQRCRKWHLLTRCFIARRSSNTYPHTASDYRLHGDGPLLCDTFAHGYRCDGTRTNDWRCHPCQWRSVSFGLHIPAQRCGTLPLCHMSLPSPPTAISSQVSQPTFGASVRNSHRLSDLTDRFRTKYARGCGSLPAAESYVWGGHCGKAPSRRAGDGAQRLTLCGMHGRSTAGES